MMNLSLTDDSIARVIGSDHSQHTLGAILFAAAVTLLADAEAAPALTAGTRVVGGVVLTVTP